VTGHGEATRRGRVTCEDDCRYPQRSDYPHLRYSIYQPTDPNVDNTYDLPDVTDPGVPAYTWDIAQTEMAILASVAGLAAPVDLTESSADFGNFLAPDHRHVAAGLDQPGGG
jgi:hypothetical protein